MTVKARKRKALPPHWYKTTIHACPVCGRERVYRERQFTPRPKDPRERFEYDGLMYDWCMW